MNIYQSSMEFFLIQELWERLGKLFKKINVLLSYGIPSDVQQFDNAKELIDNIILDSGAWTLNNKKSGGGIVITNKGYEIFLKKFGHMFKYYFNLDSNFFSTPEGFRENLNNQKKLEEAGLKPVPVIHDYYRFEIDYYIDQGYDIVALGSIFNPITKKQERTYSDVAYAVEKLIKLKSDIKIHLFASSSIIYLPKFPLFSSDSSNWSQNSRYGYILYWNENKKGFNKTEKIFFEDFYEEEEDKQNRVYFKGCKNHESLEDLTNRLGITDEDLIGLQSYYYRKMINTVYYIKIEEEITKEHKRQGFLY